AEWPAGAEVVGAAGQDVGRARFDELVAAADALPLGPRHTETVLGLLADLYTGPLFQAALELWVAARTDPQLHAVVAPLEVAIGREAHQVAVRLLNVDGGRPGAREAVQATMDFLRGLGLAGVLSDDRRRRGRLITRWATMLDATLAG